MLAHTTKTLRAKHWACERGVSAPHTVGTA